MILVHSSQEGKTAGGADGSDVVLLVHGDKQLPEGKIDDVQDQDEDGEGREDERDSEDSQGGDAVRIAGGLGVGGGGYQGIALAHLRFTSP